MTDTNQNSAASDLPKQIDRFIHALSGIRSLSKIQSKELLESEYYQRIVKVILTYVDLESCSLFINKDGAFICGAGLSWGDEHDIISRLPSSSNTFHIGQGVLGLCAEKQELIHCSDSENDENFIQLSGVKPNNVGSLICAPLISNHKLLGVLNISHPESHYFEQWHEKIIVTFANIVAQMLDHHRLIHSMEEEIYTQTRELKLSLQESEELRRRYQELSFIDYLSELHNRRYFLPEFTSSIANAQRHRHKISLLNLDLDHFKSINDNYGHELGDAVLVGISQLLKRQVRTGDLLARLGGEEFAIALIGTDAESAKQFADRIRIMISDLNWSYQNEKVGVTASIGITTLEKNDDNPEDIVRTMLSEADSALYACKHAGRNQIMCYADLASQKSSRNIG